MIKSVTPYHQFLAGRVAGGGTVGQPNTLQHFTPKRPTNVPKSLAPVDLTNNISSSNPGAGTNTIPIKVMQVGTDRQGKPIFQTQPSSTASSDQPKTGCSLTTLDQCNLQVLTQLGTWGRYITFALIALAVIVVIKR